MKILYIAHRVPYPPDKGDKIRSYHTIKHLSSKHHVHLACLAWSPQELESAKALSDYCDSIDVALMHSRWSKVKSLGYLFHSRPLTLPFFSSRRLRQLIDRRIEEERFDAIMVYSSSMAQYVPADADAFKIMDFVDADSDKWQQYAERIGPPLSFIYRFESKKLRKYEASLAPWYDYCTVISRTEERFFRSISTRFVLKTVPNGVDLEYYQPSRGQAQGTNLLFMGMMDYYANVDAVLYFCDQILPRVHKRFPEATFTVVGGNPVGDIQRLDGRNKVTVLGYVRDVRPHLQAATVFVAPLRIARGVQNKILEAMASGLPVVATSQALDGIEAHPGRDALVADAPEDFADQTAELLLDRQRREKIAQSARRLVEQTYQWDRCLQRFDQILEIRPQIDVEISGGGR